MTKVLQAFSECHTHSGQVRCPCEKPSCLRVHVGAKIPLAGGSAKAEIRDAWVLGCAGDKRGASGGMRTKPSVCLEFGERASRWGRRRKAGVDIETHRPQPPGGRGSGPCWSQRGRTGEMGSQSVLQRASRHPCYRGEIQRNVIELCEWGSPGTQGTLPPTRPGWSFHLNKRL